ncbi:MAG: hypothetical protein AAFQ98_18585 [Bacteroidota bacterium]
MALAHWKQTVSEGSEVALTLDLGSNAWFEFEIGYCRYRTPFGTPRLRHVKHRTPLQGPVASGPGPLPRTALPGHLFDRKHRYLQLISYRTADRAGPCYSDIVPVGLASSTPSVSLTTEEIMQGLPEASNSYTRIREIPLSQSASVGEVLTSVLPGLLGLFAPKNKGKGAPKAAEVAQTVLQNEDVQALLKLLMEKMTGGKVSTAKSLPGHSQAMFDPMTIMGIANVGAKLMPAVQDAVKGITNPEFIKAVMPTGKILDVSSDFLKSLLGLDEKVEVEWSNLDNINSSGNEAIVQAILGQTHQQRMAEKMTAAQSLRGHTAKSLRKHGVKFIPTSKVQLTIADADTPANLMNMSHRVYSLQKDARFPLRLETPRGMKQAKLKMCLKTLQGEVVIPEKRVGLKNVQPGLLDRVPRLTRQELAGLEPTQEYILNVQLTWPSKNGPHLGTSLQQIVCFVEDLAFDRLEKTEAPAIALNDVEKHRAYWHKVWSATLTEKMRDVALDAKYYYRLADRATANQRLETATQLAHEHTNDYRGKLKSGMELSLQGLNTLLPELTGEPSLSREELALMETASIEGYMNKLARHRMKFWGSVHEQVTLWVYPEVQPYAAHFKRVSATNANGLVTAFETTQKQLLVPVSAHFIGTKR